MPKTTGGDSGAPFTLPGDLSSLTLDQLAELKAQARAEISQLLERKDRNDLPKAGELAKAVAKIEAREGEIKTEQAETDAEFDRIAQSLGTDEPADGEGVEDDATGESVEDGTPAVEAETAPVPQAVTASTRPKGGAVTAPRDSGGLSGGKHKLNPTLRDISGLAPAASRSAGTMAAQPLAITASRQLPNQLDMGAPISSLRQVGDLMEHTARGLPDAGGQSTRRRPEPYLRVGEIRDGRKRKRDEPYGGVQVASVRNSYDHVFSRDSSMESVQAYIDGIESKRTATRFAAEVASGGWCAPPQVRYDFFNIADECGMVDLPTFGVERGGLMYPVSPSLADTFVPALPWYTAFTNATVPWLWTNGDDILAATGAPEKPCIHVPCSTTRTDILECYGICLTAGNLADNAWPEATRNFLRLLMAAHYHASNARYLSTMVGLSTAFAGCSATGTGTAAPLLMTAELAAIDIRTKYGQCGDAVIEQIYPEWAIGPIRADMAKRTGVAPRDAFNISMADVQAWFDVRNIRAQFVQDYQVRAAGQPGVSAGITQWPSSVKFLSYSAGTFGRGNGMTLDLGVVRDSTLNATNDFTAAWMEECHMISMFGHESREYTVNICPDGTTGAADLTSCC